MKTCPVCNTSKHQSAFSAVKNICNLCHLDGKTYTPPEKVRKPTEAEILQAELAARTLARRRLIHFVQRFKPDYQAGWVHHDICRRLEQFVKDVEAKKSPRLLLCMPPRAGKSELTSRNFPAWALGHHPEWEIIAASHTQSLALSFSRHLRDKIRDPAYEAVFPDCVLDPQSQSVENWMTTAGGGYMAAGVGTGITGRGAHCLPLTERIVTSGGVKSLNELIKDTENAHYVLSYSGTLEYRKINAYLTRKAAGYYRVALSDGTSFCATGEHPVCVDLGVATPVFRRLDDLRTGESVVTFGSYAPNTEAQNGDAVPGLQHRVHQESVKLARSEGCVRELDPHVQQQVHGCDAIAHEKGASALRRMQKAVLDLFCRACSPKRAWRQARVLLKRVLRGVQVKIIRWGEAPQLLQGRSALHYVQKDVPATIQSFVDVSHAEPFLLEGVLPRMATWSSYPEGYRSSFATVLPVRVQGCESKDAIGESAVCSVHVPCEGSTPQGREHREQRTFKSGTCVSSLPYETSRRATSPSIESIEYVEGDIVVGDIEVEGAHNFVHESGILLLNCLIVDDPVKDMEAADSQLIRDNTWDWYTCFHPETEILTYDGWKPVSEVALREAVATMDMSSGEMYYMPAVEVQSYDFDGELVDVWQRSGVSYRVTPNHNLHIASSKTGPIRTVRADETPETFYIPRSAKVFLGGNPPARTGFRAQHVNGKDFSCATTTWFKFFGAWLGDGSIYAPRGQVVLSAIKPRKRKFFTKVLSEMGVTFWEQEKKVTFQNVEVARYLERFGGSHEKYIPENMKHAATPYLEALLEGLFETDGHAVDVDRRYRYVTTSKQLADDVMELAVKCGYAVSYSVRPIDTYHLSLRKTYMTQVDARVRGKTSAPVRQMVPYKGKVHCVTVPPHHSVLIRDRGRISWSGQSTAYTRLAPGGGVLGIMTLWNDDDWGGRTITYSENGEGDKFEIVRYPAINEGYDEYQENETYSIVKKYPADPIPDNATLIRKADSALHPDRYDTEMLLKIKRNLYASGQQRVWSALYQQNPAPEEGAYFTKDLFRYYSTPPRRRGNFVYQAWDFAIAEGQENDYTVGATILQDERDALHVLDVKRFKSADSIYIVDVILDYAAEFDADLLGFEDGQIWKTMQAQFDKRCDERRMYPTYEILKPLTDKKARANPLKGRMQAGKVYFPDKAPWLHDVYTELLRFPAGKHDDVVDALAWAVRLTLTRSAPKLPEPAKIKSWKDKLLTGGSLEGTSHMAA